MENKHYSHNLIDEVIEKGYGVVFIISPQSESNYEIFEYSKGCNKWEVLKSLLGFIWLIIVSR